MDWSQAIVIVVIGYMAGLFVGIALGVRAERSRASRALR